MRLCRFTLKNDAQKQPRLGILGEDGIRDVTAAADTLPPLRWPLPPGDHFLNHFAELRPQIEALAATAPVIARADANLLAPVANPGKFVCGVGNWKHHGAPLGMMGFLFKMTSAAAGESDGVQIRWTDRTTLHEPELAIVIGKQCTNVSEADALNYVAGYTCALDMTMKEVKEFYTFCKSFDTYGTLGPCLVTPDEIPNPSELGYQFWVNGELRGTRKFSDLTGSPAQLVAFASSAMTLYPGDVIFSGAADVGPVVPGDVMTIEIPRIGRMDVAFTVSANAR
jgi:2,4-diketo-3-deoxy-L-fuconate hydrolase